MDGKFHDCQLQVNNRNWHPTKITSQTFSNITSTFYHWCADLDYNSVDADQILRELICVTVSATINSILYYHGR